MITTHFESAVKSSVVYSYAISQSLASYFTLFPIQHDEFLLQQQSLKIGDSGEVVRLIQLKLNHLGYYDDLIDGKFGLLTEYALKQFQSSHNITVSGTTDELTMKTLIREEKEKHIAEINKIITKIHFGEQSENVLNVQKKLNYLGYYDGNIDGIYGTLTKEAIEKMNGNHLQIVSNNESIVETHVNTEIEKQVKIKPEIKGNNLSIIETARSYIGTPYVWGGESPDGFDCSGFIQFVYNEQNKTIPRTVNDIWNFSEPIDSPSVGDLVFFETYKPGPSHLGIYLGNNEFIHASTSNGVSISNLDQSYWKENYIGAKRIY